MNIKQLFFTENECYKRGRKHTVRGIMVHSTGANNPNLCRYVGPDDGVLGTNRYGNHWNQYRPDGRQVCVHGFIGKDKNGVIRTYQTLPWDMVGWHSGGGSKGSANNMGYVGFEICEDGLTDRNYFNQVYAEAVDLCAYLCKQYGLNPKTAIICHSEGCKQGIASNHGDVMHWFPKHGKSMDTFRNDVAAKLNAGNETPSQPTNPSTGYKVGDIVNFTGGPVYKSSDASTASVTRGASKCKITATYKGKHPYHCISEDDKDVYGWVDASAIGGSQPSQPEPVRKSVDEIAREVIQGKWGNGQDRKNRLTKAGYNYSEVQAKVNSLL